MAPRKETAASAAQAQQDASSEGIESFELPKSLVTRLAKSALPSDAKLQKDTVVALVKGSTVFINYLAATAQDVAASRSHKTIAGADVLKALEIIEFGDLVPLLESELEVYRLGAKTDKGKGKAADIDANAKGMEKELSSASTPVPSTDAVQPAVAPVAAPAADADPGPGEIPVTMLQDDRPMDEDEPPEEGEDEDIEEVVAAADDEPDLDEPEDVVDTVAMETEELQKDQRGLEGAEVGIKDAPE